METRVIEKEEHVFFAPLLFFKSNYHSTSNPGKRQEYNSQTEMVEMANK
jgi:hypothetical protein